MKTALFVGRFQPIHKAHLKVIKKIISEGHKLLIGIGRAQESKTALNPFTKEERKEMIERVLKAEGITNYKIVFIPDKKKDDDWIEHTEKICGKFDPIYSGNPETKHVFQKTKHKIVDVKLVKGISSTLIRKKIVEGKEWKKLVHQKVYDYVVNKYGIEKLKKIIQKSS
jgi:nicotinamide-nucleotide adenylyltransferase